MKVRDWIAAAALMVWALAAFGAPVQNQPIDIDRLRVRADLMDRTPLGMITLAGDHHGCADWPSTQLKPLADANRIKATVYITRTPATPCSAGGQLTDALLQALASDPYIEIGSHVGGGIGNGAHFLLPSGHGEGVLMTDATVTVRGNGTTFASADVTRVLHIPGERAFPYLITAVTDARTLTVSPATASIYVGSYWVYETESTSTVSVDGSPTPSAVMTCTAGCAWNATDFVVASDAFTGAVGSMVLIAGAPANPYFVASIGSATSITLDKTINIDLTAVEYAILPWFETVRTFVKNGRDELEADAGLATGKVRTIGAPLNAGSPIIGPYLKHTLGIESVASDIIGNPYIFPGTTDGTFIDRLQVSGHWGVKSWKNLIDSVADSGAWVVTNMENVIAADYKTGTANVTAGSNAVTGTSTLWATAAALASCRTTPSDCWIFWKDDPDPMSYRIASFDTETQLTLDPLDTSFGSSVDVDSTPANNQSGNYWIVNLGGANSTCRNIATGACVITVTEALDQAMIYLDANRERVIAVTHWEGLQRFRQLSYGYRDAAVNLLPNPKFRLGRLDLLPPRALFTTGTGNTDLAIFGWTFSISGNMNATTTVSVDAAGVLTFSNTGAAGPRLVLSADVVAPYGGDSYVVGADMEPPASGGTTTRFMIDVQTLHQINMNDTQNVNTFRLPLGAAIYAAGLPRTFAYTVLPNFNPGIYKARFDCDPEPCANPSDVLASRTQSGNASPDPFVMDASSATAGVYTITYPPTGNLRPLMWITPLTALTNCRTGVPGRSSVVITCVNDAGVGVDTDFQFALYDPAYPTSPLSWRVAFDTQCLSTTSTNGCKWASPFLMRGDMYRRD